MFYRKFFLCKIILLLLVFVIAACTNNESHMEPKEPPAENSTDIDSALLNSPSKVAEISLAYQAYISILKPYEEASKNKYSTNCSTLTDLDGDGQEELLFFYDYDYYDSIRKLDAPMVAYQVWTFKDNKSVLLMEEDLFSTAGDPYGGLSVFELEGQTYFCAWYFNGSIGVDYDYSRYKACLYDMSTQPFSLKYTFVFENCYDNEDGYDSNTNLNDFTPRQPVLQMGEYYHNDIKITVSEYLYYWDIFNNITARFLDTVSYWDDHAGVPAHQLISHMKDILASN